MLKEVITVAYEGRVRLQEPLILNNADIPDELKDILAETNGIMETMTIPQKAQPVDVGWIIYPYDMICRETELCKKSMV